MASSDATAATSRYLTAKGLNGRQATAIGQSKSAPCRSWSDPHLSHGQGHHEAVHRQQRITEPEKKWRWLGQHGAACRPGYPRATRGSTPRTQVLCASGQASAEHGEGIIHASSSANCTAVNAAQGIGNDFHVARLQFGIVQLMSRWMGGWPAMRSQRRWLIEVCRPDTQ